jgi:GMP synthase (glutamine-hydrolysing)
MRGGSLVVERMMSEFDVAAFLEEQVLAVREALKDEKALIAISGGVDSTVSALITRQAVEDDLICVLLDHNFLRLGEPENVRSLLGEDPISLDVKVRNERERFMEALEGLSDAEEKRKVFRDTFYEAIAEAAAEEGCDYLVQGTIRADVEETVQGIKTQHNVLEQGGINPFERFGLKIIEPVRNLYKYQVRELARYMEVPPEVSERQPFPGPGLSIRVVGEITPEKLDDLKKATFIVEESFDLHGPDQFFAAIFGSKPAKELKMLKRDAAELFDLDELQVDAGVLPEKSTGVREGKRIYGSTLAIGVKDRGGETKFPDYEYFPRIRQYVKDNYPEAARVLIEVDSKGEDGCVVAMRAVKTKDYLTAKVAEIPWITLTEVSERIFKSCQNVAGVYYDITPKPPATIEYE